MRWRLFCRIIFLFYIFYSFSVFSKFTDIFLEYILRVSTKNKNMIFLSSCNMIKVLEEYTFISVKKRETSKYRSCVQAKSQIAKTDYRECRCPLLSN